MPRLRFETFAGAIPEMEQQIMSNWCWAACTVYVCNLYDSHPGITQRQFVADLLQMPVCALNFPNPDCNVMMDLAIPFSSVGHLDNSPVELPLTKEEVINFFQGGGRCLGCQIFFPDFGHAVIIADIHIDSFGDLFLVVADPGTGSINTVRYDVFRTNYLGQGGRWTRSYFTRDN